MKRDVSMFVGRCLNCQQIKDDHQKITELLQPLKIPDWKWKMISTNFIDGLSRTKKRNEGVDYHGSANESAHFIPVKPTETAASLMEIYMREIVRLYGVPMSIVSDRDPIFTSRFWKALQVALGTKSSMSVVYHPQTNRQTERVNRILEDMLRVCILDFEGS